MFVRSRRSGAAVLAAAVSACTAAAAGTPPAPDTLELSLEDLMNVVVTSVSKKSQTLAETAAAAYVISADDIRRSGAANIPEALRLAPGVQVSAIGNNKWAVSIRGFADRFANKLLVLVDGRSVYTPLFSGVLWETLDVPLDSIERIEVIRGPGASIWGANAVNGVINIITRPAFDSSGGEISLEAGTELRAAGTLRYGWIPKPDTAVVVQAFATNVGTAGTFDGSDGEDDWLHQGAGARVEHLFDGGSLRIDGSASRSLAGDMTLVTTLPPASRYVQATQRVEQQSLLARWDSAGDAPTRQSVQAYVTHSNFEHVFLREERNTADFEYQQELDAGERHDVTWGVGARHSRDRVEDSTQLSADRAHVESTLVSLYVQDEIELQPDRWRLSLGARLEYNDFTDLGLQPNVRLLWTPGTRDTWWSSAARALRTPSRLERGATILLDARPGLPGYGVPPSVVESRAGPIGDERVDALELGWRHQLSPGASIDLAAFSYRYERIRGSTVAAPYVAPDGYLVIPTHPYNATRADEFGAEASVQWQPVEAWTLQANYSWLNAARPSSSKAAAIPSEYLDVSPEHQLSVRSSLALPHAWRWDLWVRAVSDVAHYDVPGYATLDLRLAWQPTRHVEIALVGQNLLDAAHPEFGTQFIQSRPAQVQRGGYATVDWKF